MRLAASDRKRQILSEAMKLFSEQGFDGTSTRQIADAAGINEALIFRHFKTKEELYWAVLADRAERRGRNRKIRQLLSSRAEVREVLVGIATVILDRTPEDTAVTRLLFYSALRNPELSDRFFQTYAHELFDSLARYFEQEMKAGRFRICDPMLAARSLVGMIIYHYLIHELFAGSRYDGMTARGLAEKVIDLFLGGIAVPKRTRQGQSTAGSGQRELLAVK